MTMLMMRKKIMSEIHANELSLAIISDYCDLVKKTMSVKLYKVSSDDTCERLSEKSLGEYWNDPENDVWDRI